MEKAVDHDFSVSNEELLEMCKRQDHEALRVLFKRHERPVYGLLLRMLSNHDDAEEALADVFVKVWRGAAKFKGDSKFTTWLFRIAANTARDVLRSRKNKQEISMEDVVVNGVELVDRIRATSGDPAAAALAADGMASIVNAMQRLSDEDRLLISLYHFEERDYDEIAQIMEIPANNLKVKLFRARQRLRKLCEDMEKDGNADEMRPGTTRTSGLQQGAAEWA